MAEETSLFDTAVYRRGRFAATPARFSVEGAGLASLSGAGREAFQVAFRSALAKALGGLDEWERVPLDPIVTETAVLDGYRRETLHFATRPGLRANGYLLIPDGAEGWQRPAVLCVPGHGRGVDSIVGIAEDGSQRPIGAPAEYAADYALQCVARGYTVLAMEMIGFGQRRDAETRHNASAGSSSCHKDSMGALMLGETMAGWRVWDAMRALDYLQTRTDCVKPERLAMMGCSGGGTVSLFTAALDTRLRATVVSAYFNTYAESILAIPHCVDNFVPGLLTLCEMPDLAALVAPRGLFVESGTADSIFPAASFQKAAAKALKIYTEFGAPEQFGAELFEGEHGFHGTGAFAFLERVL